MSALIFIINTVFQIYILLLLVRAVLPWIPHNRFHPVVSSLYSITEPVLAPIRRGLPPMRIGVDASPFIAMILLWLLQQIILWALSLL